MLTAFAASEGLGLCDAGPLAVTGELELGVDWPLAGEAAGWLGLQAASATTVIMVRTTALDARRSFTEIHAPSRCGTNR